MYLDQETNKITIWFHDESTDDMQRLLKEIKFEERRNFVEKRERAFAFKLRDDDAATSKTENPVFMKRRRKNRGKR